MKHVEPQKVARSCSVRAEVTRVPPPNSVSYTPSWRLLCGQRICPFGFAQLCLLVSVRSTSKMHRQSRTLPSTDCPESSPWTPICMKALRQSVAVTKISTTSAAIARYWVELLSALALLVHHKESSRANSTNRETALNDASATDLVCLLVVSTVGMRDDMPSAPNIVAMSHSRLTADWWRPNPVRLPTASARCK